jgi:hypothetical protein
MCTVPLPPGVYPIAVDKYINMVNYMVENIFDETIRLTIYGSRSTWSKVEGSRSEVDDRWPYHTNRDNLFKVVVANPCCGPHFTFPSPTVLVVLLEQAERVKTLSRNDCTNVLTAGTLYHNSCTC